jgi:hypothetical protein
MDLNKPTLTRLSDDPLMLACGTATAKTEFVYGWSVQGVGLVDAFDQVLCLGSQKKPAWP